VDILLLGPYIGSFKEEVLNFRPYARWLFDVVDHDIVYINTHSNRKFLYYDFVDSDHIVPIFENISRDELSQIGYIHNSIDQKDYNLMTRGIKDLISAKENIQKKDIVQYSVNYIKSTPSIEIHKKRFEKIIPIKDEKNKYKDKIVFIPDESGNKSILNNIKYYLNLENMEYIIAGDKRTYFQNENVVLNRIDYFKNGWKYIIQLIQEAKAVICPLSHWTTICNLHKIPVFSWGYNIGQHREGGIYHFDNKDCITISIDDETNFDIIISMINFFLKGIDNGL